jgi:hypothetical protein
MAFQMTYPKKLTLEQLNKRMHSDEGGAGSVTKLAHSTELTLADFDEGPPPPKGSLLLAEMKSDDDKKRKGYKFICKGTVWVEEKPENVGAFRKT